MAQPLRHHDDNVQACARHFERWGSGSHNANDLFRDAVHMAYCALVKPTERTEEAREAREASYMDTVRRYTRGRSEEEEPRGYRIVRECMPETLSMLMRDTAQHGPRDFLGMVAGLLGTLNASMGQFFTPEHLCDLISGITISDQAIRKAIARKGHMTVMEPACGGGGMVLSLAKRMRELGFKPEKALFVTAVDLNPLAYKMAYVQLAVNGIPARVLHQDALDPGAEPYDKAVTAAYFTDFVPAMDAFLNPPVISRRRARPIPIAAE